MFDEKEINRIAPTSATVVGSGTGGTGRGLSKHLRACLVCGILRTRVDFLRFGCPNCEEWTQIRSQGEERLREVTSDYFEGMCAVTKPGDSWVAKWTRTSKYVPGLYAVHVFGRLPDDDVNELENHGLIYRWHNQ